MTKRTSDDVVMPIDPPYSVLRWLAGEPLILAASDEQSLRMQWAELRVRVRAAAKDRKVLPSAKEMRGILK